MGREAIWRRIVAAHKEGEIDLESMSQDQVAVLFECSTHTVKCARQHLNIKKRVVIRPFQEDEKWNTERRDYLEHWPR